jgi:integrating conjugative element protein (TIGR03765 family)
MNRLTSLIALIGLPIASAVFAQTAVKPLIVVEDGGGVSALPYYRALKLLPAPVAPRPQAVIPMPGKAISEADMLPVRSTRLSPGDVERRVIRAPGLTPLFLIGADPRSRGWLRQRASGLREIGAAGLVVNVTSLAELQALRDLAPGVMLSPVSADDLADRLGIRHYPVLITATSIEP